jgi:hypothetical protein
MTALQQLTDAQASAEVPVNENFDTVSAVAIYGKRHPASTGLTWGYYGGLYDGHTIANGTVTLTDSSTNYVVVNRSTGAVSVSTSTTNWNNAGGYARIYQLTTVSGAVTAVVDARMDTGGVLFSGGGGGGGSGEAADIHVVDAGDYFIADNAEDILQEIGAALGGGGLLSDEEFDDWRRKAAQMDPAAYSYYIGTSWSVTVPAGECWWVVNAWNAKHGALGKWVPPRTPNQPMLLTEGYNLQSNGTTDAFAYIFNPYAIPATGRYADPKGLFYERRARLKTLQTYQQAVTFGSGGGSRVYSAFPEDFDFGLILGAANMDAAWVILADATHGLLNLGNEISDVDQNRVAEGMPAFPMPFERATFPGIAAQPISAAGEATVNYVALPSDW